MNGYMDGIRKRRCAVIAAAAIVRMGYLGFVYYPLLDDYIQYGVYPWVAHPFAGSYMRVGLYAARPLAGLADIYLWGRLWGNLGVALLAVTVLHALSAYLFLRVSEEIGTPLGIAFAVFYTLCPVNFEGSYWLSASSRIVVGLFFVSLSMLYLARHKKVRFLLFLIAAALLYEQVAVLGFALSGIVICRRKVWGAALPVAGSVVFLALYYRVFSGMGGYAYRAAAFRLFNLGAAREIAAGWAAGALYSKGFARGMGILLTDGVPYLALIITAAVLLGAMERARRFDWKTLAAGIALFA
ncbi:MAG: hypothetical protein LBH54_01195, partial [Clostridiales bacterium]|nr:hypothetical protein [Clostridiales bacterium]